MIAAVRKRLTYSNVIASLVLFIALGGAAVAATAIPRNSVGPNQLKRGAVTAAKIRKQAVTSAKLAPQSVINGKLAANSVGPGNIGNGAVTTAKLAKASVIAETIKNSVVTTNKLNNEAVTTPKLANESVSSAKLGKGSVTSAKLSDEIGPLLGTLKTGQTLRGQFAAGAGSGIALNGQSFAFPLNNAPKSEVISPATATTANCPGITGGNGQTPQAAAGWLCVYVTNASNVSSSGVTVLGISLTRVGFGVEVTPEAGGNFSATGQWAVTAP